MPDLFLEAIENLSRFHRDHEKFYAQRPREQAVALQRHSRALSALADRWEHVDALAHRASTEPTTAPTRRRR